jgi:hypothetical protein
MRRTWLAAFTAALRLVPSAPAGRTVLGFQLSRRRQKLW